MKMKKGLPLVLLGASLLLPACDTKGSSLVPSSEPSLPESSLSTSIYEKTLADSLNLLKIGYEVEGYGTVTLGEEVSYSHAVFANTTTSYSLILHDATKNEDESFNEGAFLGEMHYVQLSSTSYAQRVHLGFDNVLHYSPLNDAKQTLVEAGYGNAFRSLSMDKLTKNDKGDYTVNADYTLYKEFATQFSDPDATVKGVTLLTEDTDFVGIRVETEFEGGTHLFEGSFIHLGIEEDPYTPKPWMNDSDPLFQEGMALLHKGANFSFQSTNSRYNSDYGDFVISSIIQGEYNAKNSMSFKIYDGNGSLQAEAGMVQLPDKKVQTVYAASEFYPDGNPLDGDLFALLPEFSISSVFFEKVEKPSYNVYYLRHDLPKEMLHLYDTQLFDMFGAKEIGDLKIGVAKDLSWVEFINETDSNRTRVHYGDIGQIDEPILASAVNENSDAALWSELAAYIQEGSAAEETILSSVKSMDILDLVPTFGGVYANTTFFDAGGYLGIMTNVSNASDRTESALKALKETYVTRLTEAGFTETTEVEPTEGGTVYAYKEEVSYEDPESGESLTGKLTVELSFYIDETDKSLHLAIFPYVQ